MEAMAGEPGLAGQIGGGQTVFACGGGRFRAARRVPAAVRRASRKGSRRSSGRFSVCSSQVGGFVPGVVAAVTEKEAGGREAADGVAQVVADGEQFAAGGGIAHRSGNQVRSWSRICACRWLDSLLQRGDAIDALVDLVDGCVDRADFHATCVADLGDETAVRGAAGGRQLGLDAAASSRIAADWRRRTSVAACPVRKGFGAERPS
jgi:hypothetical protein